MQGLSVLGTNAIWFLPWRSPQSSSEGEQTMSCDAECVCVCVVMYTKSLVEGTSRRV